jgi:hypothetical protein
MAGRQLYAAAGAGLRFQDDQGKSTRMTVSFMHGWNLSSVISHGAQSRMSARIRLVSITPRPSSTPLTTGS